MKCPRCSGIGSVPYHIDEDIFDETVCPVCHGSGEVEVTNEVWLKSMNTEQFAETIAQYFYGWTTNSTPYDIILHSVVEWLKQPHKE